MRNRWRRATSVASNVSTRGAMKIPVALRMGAENPVAGSLRSEKPLKIVPNDITTNAIVMDAVAIVALGVSGPKTSGARVTTKSVPP